MDAALFAGGAVAAALGARWLASRRGAAARGRAARLEAPAVPVPGPFLGGATGAALTELVHCPVQRLAELFPAGGSAKETFESPLVTRRWPRNQNFVGENEEIVTTQHVHAHAHAANAPPRAFLAAGPMERLVWDPKSVRAAIVTCGGLCPGLNTVIRELVMCMSYVYGVPAGHIFGVQNGYRGFYESPLVPLGPDSVGRIHTQGGTILGSSRGGFDAERILAAVTANGLNVLYIIGGDGTHRGAAALLTAAVERGIRLSIACIPKTIDNDIGIIDKSFGFDTAVEQAVRPLNCAHTEALAAKNGVGLVKLMGRASGYIALYASLASRDVNVTLLPEAEWRLSALLPYLEKRLEARGHCLIVVAEGAEAVEAKEARAAAAAAAAAGGGGAGGGVKTDESGNPVLEDVGTWLRDRVIAHFKKQGVPLNLKYIDPSYIIRSSPANAVDSALCTSLAFNAVHGAMGGYTGFTVGVVDNVSVWLPVTTVASMPPRKVDVESRIYARLCNCTGQPDLSGGAR